MKISVALCTYNGAEFLQEQLESIIGQTDKANEIVVCDDGSTDNTMGIIKKIADGAPSISWVIEVNERRLGISANFEKAISLCTGDLIFLSDQDDVWKPGKIETIKRFFKDHPEKDAVFTNTKLFGDTGKKSLTGWDAIYFRPLDRLKIEQEQLFRYVVFYGNVVTGATMALRQNVINYLVPFQLQKHMLHDEWMALKLLSLHKLGILDEELMYYRIHHNQQIGIGTAYENTSPYFLQNYIKDMQPNKIEPLTLLQLWLSIWQRLQMIEKFIDVPKKFNLELYQQLTEARNSYLQSHKWLIKKLKLVKWYFENRYFINWKDLFIV